MDKTNDAPSSKGKARPNLIVMVVCMTGIVGIGAAVLSGDALPLMTGAVGALGTLGLALVKPDEDDRVKMLEAQAAESERELMKAQWELEKAGSSTDPHVTVPASIMRDVTAAPMDAFQEGFNKGFHSGHEAGVAGAARVSTGEDSA